MSGPDLKKTKMVLESDYLMMVHKFAEAEVRFAQQERSKRTGFNSTKRDL